MYAMSGVADDIFAAKGVAEAAATMDARIR
jgi:hypothetical protein